MTHSFLAFIDEAGDDGLSKFSEPGQKGASHWLILSALIIRQTHYLETVDWRNEILQNINSKKKELHFKNLKHEQKVVACQYLSERPVRIINVIAAKKQIQQEIFSEKNQLYFYLSRFLIERISWLCRDLRPKVREGNGLVKIMFSRRGGMSYDDFREYLENIKNTDLPSTTIHWPVIDINAVDAQDHSVVAALQLADIAPSAFFRAVQYNDYGNCEDRYAKILKPIVYKNKRYLDYGIKFFPT